MARKQHRSHTHIRMCVYIYICRGVWHRPQRGRLFLVISWKSHVENPRRPCGQPVNTFLEPLPPQRNSESMTQAHAHPNPPQTQESLMFQGFIGAFQVKDHMCSPPKVAPGGWSTATQEQQRAGKDGQQDTETHLPQ